MRPIAVLSSGMICSVGLDAATACAAIRAGIAGAEETEFMDKGGGWILGHAVPLEPPLRGLEKLVHLASSAIKECLSAAGAVKSDQIPLLVCVPEKRRPGRFPGLPDEMLPALQEVLHKRFHTDSAVISEGRVGVVHALRRAEELIYDRKAPYCLVAGVDSLLVGETLASLERKHRLLTSVHSDGFIPGEAAAALLVGPASSGKQAQLVCRGTGLSTEPAPVESGDPLRAEGLLVACREALSHSGDTFETIDFRIVDVSGEQYAFKESSLVAGRGIRKTRPHFPLWHPADCIGEVGAAAGPALLAVLLAAYRKNYAPGPGALCHLGSDDGARGAIVLRFQPGRN